MIKYHNGYKKARYHEEETIGKYKAESSCKKTSDLGNTKTEYKIIVFNMF